MLQHETTAEGELCHLCVNLAHHLAQHPQGIIQRLLLNSHIYLHEFVWDTKQFSLTDQKTDEAVFVKVIYN